MRGATKTTDELRHFWNESRAVIEEQYASRLAALAKTSLGGDEIGELRNSLDILLFETEKQAEAHKQLSSSIRTVLETPTSVMHAKQVNHRRNVQAAVEKKFKTKQTQESYVAKAKEKYDADCVRIQSFTQQCATAQGKDFERAQLKLRRAQQTVQANEMDFANFTQVLLDMMPQWESDWKDFCDTCQDLEEDRLEFMKDTLWTYANEISSLCVSDDLSCERIRQALDHLEAERDIDNFIAKYGTGNLISDPARFIPYDMNDGAVPPEPKPVTHPAAFNRISRRVTSNYLKHDDPPRHHQENGRSHETLTPDSPGSQQLWAQEPNPPPAAQSQPPPQNYQSNNLHLNGPPGAPPNMEPPSPPQQAPPQQSYATPPVSGTNRTRATGNRVSGPLPTPHSHQYQYEEQPPMPTPPPHTQPQETGGVLFYVKALYDYTATIDEEFSFQAGDVIAVTSTPDDGWWSGELLDEERREEGRHVFPSNFVCLF
ncbi:hypothetical protein H0H92_003367 [Tricholoma furcatifolium]|nr:hypothetical protein H0H92_003367 [Tricholoma furcatifolium]